VTATSKAATTTVSLIDALVDPVIRLGQGRQKLLEDAPLKTPRKQRSVGGSRKHESEKVETEKNERNEEKENVFKPFDLRRLVA
jgi:hypothetical protein